MKRWLIASALALCSCGQGRSPSVADLCLDPAFSREETMHFETALEKWADLTKGKTADVQLSCERTGVNVWRLSPSAPIVAATDAQFHTQVIAFTNRENRWMWVVPERTGDYYRQVVQHELGHWNGLRWPHCNLPEDGEARGLPDCLHVPPSEGPAIMLANVGSTTEFTTSDRLFCIASGLCDL